MSGNRLAILGGAPAVSVEISPYKSIGGAEKQAVMEVLETGNLSGFFGSWRKGFLGGEKIQQLENAWCEKFGSKHAVSVNSNTSGLLVALGAIGLSPGDEVIVPPTTMSATAVMPLIYGAIPVFADIELDTFCIDVDAVASQITDKTKAVIAVNLFGSPADLISLRALCERHGLFLIEDNAQAICAKQCGKYTGTIGDIGVFSLNYHKHIHTGEGGVCVTDNPNLSQRMQMIRNHAEAVVEGANVEDLVNMIGFNLRMSELSAAVGIVQLENLEAHMDARTTFAEKLSTNLSGLSGFEVPSLRHNSTHSYYNWVAKYDEKATGVSRDLFIKALIAEGVPCFAGYVKPLYLLPTFSKRIALGKDGYPFNLSNRTYSKGLCPIAERLHGELIVGIECCAYDYTQQLTTQIIEAFLKVHDHLTDIISNKDKLVA